MSLTAASLVGCLLVLLFCVVPLLWARLGQGQSALAVRIRRQPRWLVAAALFAWAVNTGAQAAGFPLLALAGSALTVVLVFGVIILHGERLGRQP